MTLLLLVLLLAETRISAYTSSRSHSPELHRTCKTVQVTSHTKTAVLEIRIPEYREPNPLVPQTPSCSQASSTNCCFSHRRYYFYIKAVSYTNTHAQLSKQTQCLCLQKCTPIQAAHSELSQHLPVQCMENPVLHPSL